MWTILITINARIFMSYLTIMQICLRSACKYGVWKFELNFLWMYVVVILLKKYNQTIIHISLQLSHSLNYPTSYNIALYIRRGKSSLSNPLQLIHTITSIQLISHSILCDTQCLGTTSRFIDHAGLKLYHLDDSMSLITFALIRLICDGDVHIIVVEKQSSSTNAIRWKLVVFL